MEMIIFIGAQATGKSSFFKNRFFNSHVRVNLDMLKTRNRELILMQACLSARQPLVIDNTNPSKDVRKRYFQLIEHHRHVNVVGFYFQSIAIDCIRRNDNRAVEQQVPELAIRSTIRQLQLPQRNEGFTQLNYVRIEQDQFIVEEWNHELF